MTSLSEIAKASTAPVDAGLFLWCHGIFLAAASGRMPVDDPAATPLLAEGDKVYSLSDVPLNRGLLAVVKELSDRGVGTEQKVAVSYRLLQLCEVLENQEAIREFLRLEIEPGEPEVSEALIKACASARFAFSEQGTRFDIEDVARIAHELAVSEAQGKRS